MTEYGEYLRPGFNSMIVRLKASVPYESSIRLLARFNSMIVRLKDMYGKNQIHAVHGFNSMIVRLKVQRQVSFDARHTWFQFYDSPIKRIVYESSAACTCCSFNSMIVRLKDLYAP